MVERKQDTWDTFYKNILTMAKPLTKVPNLVVPFIYSRMPSGSPIMGTIWASCPGSALSGFRVDRGGWNSRQTCRSSETELPWVLGASYPPLLLPFLQLCDFSKLQVVCSSLGRTLTALALTHSHHLPGSRTPVDHQASWSGGCSLPSVLPCRDGVRQGRMGPGYPQKLGFSPSPLLIHRR